MRPPTRAVAWCLALLGALPSAARVQGIIAPGAGPINYANMPLFGQRVINGGLNWNSIFAVATGIQYQATDRLTVRGGYLHNTSPVNAPQTLFNIQAPGIITNTHSLGFSLRLTEQVVMSAAWAHGFRNDEMGPVLNIPGSLACLDAQVDSLILGLTIQYGGRRPPQAEPKPLTPTTVAEPSP